MSKKYLKYIPKTLQEDFIDNRVIPYLERQGNLEHFRYETRPHGFGINYEWLVRCGIAERYGIPERIPFLSKQKGWGIA